MYLKDLCGEFDLGWSVTLDCNIIWFYQSNGVWTCCFMWKTSRVSTAYSWRDSWSHAMFKAVLKKSRDGGKNKKDSGMNTWNWLCICDYSNVVNFLTDDINESVSHCAVHLLIHTTYSPSAGIRLVNMY